jgi:hypothetical protein
VPNARPRRDKGSDERPVAPLMLVASLAVIGLIGAAIAIAGAAAWVIGLTIGALVALAIPPLRRATLTWPTNLGACSLSVLVAVAGAVIGLGVGHLFAGGKTSPRSNRADLGATGFIEGHWKEQEAEGYVETFRVPAEGSSNTGHSIRPEAIVWIKCRRKAPGMESAGPQAYWYQLEGPPPWNSKEWVPSNSFWNNSKVIKGPGVHEVDVRVPECE